MRYNLQLTDIILTKLTAILLRLIYFSCRKKVIYASEAEELLRRNDPCLIAFWHQVVLTLPYLYSYTKRNLNKNLTVSVLISGHRDGRLIAKVASYFKIDSVTGSSSRNSISGSRELLERLSSGSYIAITPDGPKGPAKKVKEGVLRLAEISGKPIIPLSVKSTKSFHFASWDKMMLPLPFSKITFIVGKPIEAEENFLLQDVLEKN